jgi:hypothetical protein
MSLMVDQKNKALERQIDLGLECCRFTSSSSPIHYTASGLIPENRSRLLRSLRQKYLLNEGNTYSICFLTSFTPRWYLQTNNSV